MTKIVMVKKFLKAKPEKNQPATLKNSEITDTSEWQDFQGVILG